MARLNVYVPDELASAAKERGLNVSALTQQAIRVRLLADSTDLWLSTLHKAPRGGATHDDVIEALDDVRSEAPTRHG